MNVRAYHAEAELFVFEKLQAGIHPDTIKTKTAAQLECNEKTAALAAMTENQEVAFQHSCLFLGSTLEILQKLNDGKAFKSMITEEEVKHHIDEWEEVAPAYIEKMKVKFSNEGKLKGMIRDGALADLISGYSRNSTECCLNITTNYISRHV